MFNRLIDYLVEFMELFQFFIFIDEFEKGVILRQGRFHRVVGPGLRWIIPLDQEECITINVKPEPMYLDIQSMHTKDQYACNIQVGIIWRVIDAKVFLIDNENSEYIVGMLCSGVVWDAIHQANWKEITPAFAAKMKAPMNRKVRKRGAEIDEVIIQDFAAGSANRLWHEGIAFNLGKD